jgi:hypothetical protein
MGPLFHTIQARELHLHGKKRKGRPEVSTGKRRSCKKINNLGNKSLECATVEIRKRYSSKFLRPRARTLRPNSDGQNRTNLINFKTISGKLCPQHSEFIKWILRRRKLQLGAKTKALSIAKNPNRSRRKAKKKIKRDTPRRHTGGRSKRARTNGF